jgi:hypothetical protein
MQISGKIMVLLVAVLSTIFLGAGKFENTELTVKLSVPDSAWTVAVDKVYEMPDALWVISILARDPNLMGAQVISIVQDSVSIPAPDLPVKHFVMGKTWKWNNEEAYTFIDDLDQIEEKLKSGKLLYKRQAE